MQSSTVSTIFLALFLIDFIMIQQFFLSTVWLIIVIFVSPNVCIAITDRPLQIKNFSFLISRKKMAKFSPDEDEILIEIVHKHSILYNMKDAEFKTSLKKDLIRNEVGKLLRKAGEFHPTFLQPAYKILVNLFFSEMEVPGIWGIDCGDYEPECPGPPPPFFHLPPPPRPPFLHDLPDCSLELESCNAMPVIDAEYHSSPALPSVAVIVSSSVFLLAMVLVATALLCKHKKKMQSFLPCKSSPQNHCDVTHGNGVIYEDLTNIRPRPLPQPSIEMLDVKGGRCDVGYPPAAYPVLPHSPVFICPPPPRTMPHPRYCSQDLYNPVYEELSNVTGSNGRGGGSENDSEYGRHAGIGSEDEFAEDELSLAGVSLPIHHSGTSSLQGSTGNDLSRDVDSSDADDRNNRSWNFSLPPGSRPKKYGNIGGGGRPRSLERRRTNRCKGNVGVNGVGVGGNLMNGGGGECAEFHEGLLLDALLQLYPNRPIPTGHHKLPYILPVPHAQYEQVMQYHHNNHQSRPPSEYTATYRPAGHDSDSGYSHNTSGGRNSTARARKYTHRVPSHANDIVIS